MLPLKEFRRGLCGFPSLLNYFGFVDQGVLLNNNGSLTAGFYYAGPDMESSLGVEYDALSAHVNNVLKRLSDGWAVEINAIRVQAINYPQTHHFQVPLLTLIEDARRERYECTATHFENLYTLTLTFRPAAVDQKKFMKYFVDQNTPTAEGGYSYLVTQFQKTLTDIENGLSARLAVWRMDSAALYNFLGCCVTGRNIPRQLPEPAVYLNHYLGAYDLQGGFDPKIDDQWVDIISLVGFPMASYSGILNLVNEIPFPYRFSSRFIVMDPRQAEEQIKRIRRNFHNKQIDIKGMFGDLVVPGSSQSGYADHEALDKAADADLALNEARAGEVKFGYYTAVVVLSGSDKTINRQRAIKIKTLLDNHGFACRVEQANALEAYLGSLPGHLFANVRKPLIHTLNLAHMAPITNVWAGLEHNPCAYFPAQSPALFYGATTGTTPFRFNLHVSDVGHTLVFGPTGSGKSTLLSLMCASFFRYSDSQVFFFDKGFSQYALSHACGADHYNIFSDGRELTFCPLSEINQENERLWAAEWLEVLLRLQGLEMTPRLRNNIADGLQALTCDRVKTISNFYTNVQDLQIKEALKAYVQVKDGLMAGLLDAEQDGLKKSRFQCFEMEHLMSKEERYSVPILMYLFHKIDLRLDGRPTLIILDEAWLLLKNEMFAHQIEEWLRVLRKRNASVVFATNSIADIVKSPLKHVIDESCPTKIYLPSPIAASSNIKPIYASFGLNDRQIDIIANAQPKRQYYYASPLGQRLIELGLGELELAFMGINAREDLKMIEQLRDEHGPAWVGHWLKARQLTKESQLWTHLAKLTATQ